MPSPEPAPDSTLLPLPAAFLQGLDGEEELLVSSRDPHGQGRVRMWFAVSPAGHLYLLTPAISLKARRWQDDPWVRLTIPKGGASLEGQLESVGADDAMKYAAIFTERFQMAGAVTPEALRWMVDSGSHLLLRVGLPAAP
jgi:hypothetical protein